MAEDNAIDEKVGILNLNNSNEFAADINVDALDDAERPIEFGDLKGSEPARPMNLEDDYSIDQIIGSNGTALQPIKGSGNLSQRGTSVQSIGSYNQLN